MLFFNIEAQLMVLSISLTLLHLESELLFSRCLGQGFSVAPPKRYHVFTCVLYFHLALHGGF